MRVGAPRGSMALTALLLVLALRPAWGQTDEELREARVRAGNGEDLFRSENYQAAVTEFRRAYEFIQEPGLIWNIARCYEELGDAKNAVHYFQVFVGRFPDDDMVEDALRRARRLWPKMPGSVVVECATIAGARVHFDGDIQADCGERIKGVPPGKHIVEVKAPDGTHLQAKVTLDAGERRVVTEDQLRAPRPPRPNATVSAQTTRKNLVPKVMIGAGVAMLAGGLFFGISSGDAGDELAGLEGSRPVSLEKLNELESRSDTHAALANVLFVSGGVALVAGAVWFRMTPRSATTTPTGWGNWALTPTPNGGWLLWKGRL